MLQPVFLLLIATLLASCAGPADPFGSISQYSLSGRDVASLGEEGEATISFYPDRIISHQSQSFRITIFDPSGIGRNHDLRIRYNDHFIEKKWLNKANKELSVDGKTLVIDFGRLRFLPNRDNFIVASYQRDEQSGMTAKQYLNPECDIKNYQS